MGKRLTAAAAAVRSYARSLRSPSAAEVAGKAAKPRSAPLDTPRNAAAGAASSGRAEVRDLAAACGLQEDERVPLSEVVLDCTKRWFQDALKEARAGDAAMQVLVGQMYRCGYGVNKNENKANGGPLRYVMGTGGSQNARVFQQGANAHAQSRLMGMGSPQSRLLPPLPKQTVGVDAAMRENTWICGARERDSDVEYPLVQSAGGATVCLQHALAPQNADASQFEGSAGDSLTYLHVVLLGHLLFCYMNEHS